MTKTKTTTTDARIAHARRVREYVLAERRAKQRRAAREAARPECIEYEQLCAIEIEIALSADVDD